MKKKLVFVSFIIMLLFTISGTIVKAQNVDDTLKGLNASAGEVDAFKGSVGKSYDNFIQTKAGQIIGIALSFVGILFLGLVIYAGISWMTANGNQEKVAKSRGLIIDAIIGLIIVFAAYAITTFVGNQILK